MPKVKTAISIENDLLIATAVIAQELDVPRSQVVSLALEEYIRRYRNRQLLEQINAAYAVEPDEDEAAISKIIQSHQRSLGEKEEWK